MSMKKFALKGLVILAAAVALCIFFSGTVRTLTTPKVRFAQAKMGRMEQETELTGKVVFPEEEELKISVPEGMSLTVAQVHVGAGDKVKEGQTLITARVTDAEKTLQGLRKEYATAQKELRALEKKTGEIRLTRGEQRWQEAWEKQEEAREREREARVSLQAAARLAGIEIGDAAPAAEAGEEILSLYQAWKEAGETLKKAGEELEGLSRHAIQEELWTAMQQMRDYRKTLTETENSMTELQVLAKTAEKITAPRAAYVTQVNVEKGGQIDGDTVILKLTAEGKDPVIRVDLTGVKQEVSPGTAMTIDTDSWDRPTAKVINTGLTAEGHPYADAEINKDVTYALGKVSAMMKNDIKVRLVTRSSEATCLVPASAVRGSGDSRYLYVGEQEGSAFAGSRLRARKMNVTVLAESASTVSLAEDVTYQQVLYMEDRALTDGCAVMEYAKESSK